MHIDNARLLNKSKVQIHCIGTLFVQCYVALSLVLLHLLPLEYFKKLITVLPLR